MNVSPSMQLCFVAMSNSMGMVMQNAATNQRSGQIIATSTTVQCCAMIIKKGSSS